MKNKWMSQREYKRRGAWCCPACGSSKVEGVYAADVMGLRAEQHVKCVVCNSQWIDVYKLERYYILQGGGCKA